MAYTTNFKTSPEILFGPTDLFYGYSAFLINFKRWGPNYTRTFPSSLYKNMLQIYRTSPPTTTNCSHVVVCMSTVKFEEVGEREKKLNALKEKLHINSTNMNRIAFFVENITLIEEFSYLWFIVPFSNIFPSHVCMSSNVSIF